MQFQCVGVLRAFAVVSVIVSALWIAGISTAYAQVDNVLPVITNYSISPTSVDVTSSSATITVTVAATDDASGVDRVGGGLYRRVGGGISWTGKFCLATVPSAPLSGSASCTLTVDQFSDPGTYCVSATTIDLAGNDANATCDDLVTLGYDPDVAVTSVVDNTNPTITDYSISPTTVDVTNSSATVTVTIDATDDSSGVDRVGGGLYRRISGSLSWTGKFCQANVSGGPLSGSASCTLTVDQFSDPGTYCVSATAIDLAGNDANANCDDLVTLGYDPDVEVTSNPDNTNPVITNFSVTPLNANVQPSGATFTITVAATDENSGLDRVGGGLYRRANGGIGWTGEFCLANIPSASLSGSASCTITIDRFTEPGTYCASATAIDVAGNDANLNCDELVNLGYDSDIAVISVADSTPPTVAISTLSTDPVSGAFDIAIDFSESVNGFVVGDLSVGNGAASAFAGSGDSYSATITPTGNGLVTVDIAADAATDDAGNGNTVAPQFSITNDESPPNPTLTSTAPANVTGAFEVTVTFDEGVTGFLLPDIDVTNGTSSLFNQTSATVFTLLVTPAAPGTVEVSVPADVAVDDAGNGNTAGSLSREAVIADDLLALAITSTTIDPTSVGSSSTIQNPGSDPLGFFTLIDVNWLDATPLSGTIASLGQQDIDVQLNSLADALAPGNYQGTVTLSTAASGGTTLAEIVIDLSVAARTGTIQIVATTPGGTSGDETFTYASADVNMNGLSLQTNNGSATSASFEKQFGQYDLAQTLPPGWRLDSLTCSGDSDGGSLIDLAGGSVLIDLDANEAVTCTFANVRDEDLVLLATRRAINNFSVRRGDRILSSIPDLSRNLSDRGSEAPGNASFEAEDGSFEVAMNGSLNGLRNHAGDEGRFNLWFAAELTRLDDDRAGELAETDFAIAQLGADWLVHENALVGFMVQRDWMDETSDFIDTGLGAVAGATVNGRGWMAGPYAVFEPVEGVVIDALGAWGMSNNDVNPLGLYEDEFDTERFLVSAQITGEMRHGPWRLRPQARLAHYEERQEAYVDGLDITIPEETIAIGRFTAGPEVGYTFDFSDTHVMDFIVGVDMVWDYDPGELINDQGFFGADTDDIRADARVGVQGRAAGGQTYGVSVGVSGVGEEDYDAVSARAEVRIPF